MKLLAVSVFMMVVMLGASAATQQDGASEKRWVKYYSEHLPEAKQMLHACVAKGFDKIQGDEKIKCEAARDAWHFQPYRPSKK